MHPCMRGLTWLDETCTHGACTWFCRLITLGPRLPGLLATTCNPVTDPADVDADVSDNESPPAINSLDSLDAAVIFVEDAGAINIAPQGIVVDDDELVASIEVEQIGAADGTVTSPALASLGVTRSRAGSVTTFRYSRGFGQKCAVNPPILPDCCTWGESCET